MKEEEKEEEEEEEVRKGRSETREKSFVLDKSGPIFTMCARGDYD